MPPIDYDQTHPGGQTGPASHLTPALEAAVRNHQHDHVGPCTHPMPNGAETWDGKCARHKGTPAERAEQRRWERKARAMVLAQQVQAGQLGDPVRVVTQAQAAAEDSLKAKLHAMIDGLY